MNITDKPAPASSSEIIEWESYFSIQMPLDLRKVLSESNGPVMYDEDYEKELQFLSTSEAQEYYTEYGLNKDCPNSIPICLDGCSNIVVYKIDNSATAGIYAMSCSNTGWEDSVSLCNSVFDLVALRVSIEQLVNS